MKSAIVLLSGGLDSSACLGLALREGFEVTALTFSYGQRHRVEVQRARKVAERLGAADHHVVEIDLASVGGSVLTGSGSIPKNREDPGPGSVPPTYVPARNTILLAYGLAWAEVKKASAVYIGVNHVDWSGYPDCRPEFIKAVQAVARTGTKAGLEGREPVIRAPLLEKRKAEIILIAREVGVDLSLTLSCYDPDPAGRACGHCDSCLLRKKGFEEAGLRDPTEYR